jgi:hypothetical protein
MIRSESRTDSSGTVAIPTHRVQHHPGERRGAGAGAGASAGAGAGAGAGVIYALNENNVAGLVPGIEYNVSDAAVRWVTG